MVGPLGIEPRTLGFRDLYSTTELLSHEQGVCFYAKCSKDRIMLCSKKQLYELPCPVETGLCYLIPGSSRTIGTYIILTTITGYIGRCKEPRSISTVGCNRLKSALFAFLWFYDPFIQLPRYACQRLLSSAGLTSTCNSLNDGCFQANILLCYYLKSLIRYLSKDEGCQRCYYL